MIDETIIRQLPLSAQERELIAQEILDGQWGKSGDVFLSTKDLAEKRGISVVTAHRVLSALCEKGLLELNGKKYYLKYDEILKKQKRIERTIGLHVNNINNEYFSRIAKEAELTARKAGYRLIIAESGYDYDREEEILSMYRDYKVRGVLSCPGVDENTKELYEQYPVPYMFIGRTPKGFNCHSVQMNPFSICVNMAEHLVENGYTHFAYAGLAEIKPVEDLRLFGYKSGVNAAGFELVKESVLSVSAKEVTQAPGKIRDFLSALPKPAAVFCYHDLLALEFYKAAVSLGLSVPEDVGIAGFDNLFATTCATPPITTVDYRLEKMVEIAFERLTKQIQTGKYDKLNYFIEPKLMIRGSTQRTS